MLIYSIEIEEGKELEAKKTLEGLSFVKSIKTQFTENEIYLVSEKSLAEDWNSISDDTLQKLYNL